MTSPAGINGLRTRLQPSSSGSRFLPGERAAFAHLAVLGFTLAAAAAAQGGMVPVVWLACELMIGLQLVAWTTFQRATADLSLTATCSKAVLALPLYAFLQAVALPLPLVEALSPERVELQLAVATLSTDVTGWIPVSVDSGRTLAFAARLTAYTAVFWIARGLCLRLGRYALVVAAPIVAVATVEAAIALHQSHPAGASGSYVNRNHLAGLLEMALPFAVVAVVGRRPWIARSGGHLAFSGLAGACALLIVAGILATRSRAGLLAVIASLAGMGLIAVGRGISGKRKRLTGAALLPVLMVAAFVFLPSDGLVRRYGALAGSDNLAREGRLALWTETLDLVADYPLVGCGFGAYEPAFLRYKRSAPMVNDTHSHNDYLETLAEGGVIGFVICIVVAAGPVAAAIRASRRPRSGSSGAVALACVGSLTAILAHSLVDFNLRIPANGVVFFWLLGVCSTCRDRPTADRAKSAR